MKVLPFTSKPVSILWQPSKKTNAAWRVQSSIGQLVIFPTPKEKPIFDKTTYTALCDERRSIYQQLKTTSWYLELQSQGLQLLLSSCKTTKQQYLPIATDFNTIELIVRLDQLTRKLQKIHKRNKQQREAI